MTTIEDFDVLLGPIVTEKATSLSEHGQIVFKVRIDATKVQIRRAVERLFDVKVTRVNIWLELPTKIMLNMDFMKEFTQMDRLYTGVCFWKENIMGFMRGFKKMENCFTPKFIITGSCMENKGNTTEMED